MRVSTCAKHEHLVVFSIRFMHLESDDTVFATISRWHRNELRAQRRQLSRLQVQQSTNNSVGPIIWK